MMREVIPNWNTNRAPICTFYPIELPIEHQFDHILARIMDRRARIAQIQTTLAGFGDTKAETKTILAGFGDTKAGFWTNS